MIPVTQDIFGPEGNCMAACIASIFELPLREVPNFAEGMVAANNGGWFGKIWEFVRPRGFEIVPYYPKDSVVVDGKVLRALDFNNMPEHLKGVYPYYMVCGPAARGFQHACVGWNGTVLHDPHPSRAGLIEMKDYYFLKLVKD